MLVAGNQPFRWWVYDGWCTPIQLNELPPSSDAIWEARYENDCERGKRTTRALLEPWNSHLTVLQSSNSEQMWSDLLGYEVWKDPTMHGGGLHLTEPNGWLNTHLDYDAHPKIEGRRRALNFIVFLNPVWQESWGGALVFCDGRGNIHKRIYPEPGRLVAFEVSDRSYHGVEQITGPEPRVTVACYLLSEATGRETRFAAMFFPNRKKASSTTNP